MNESLKLLRAQKKLSQSQVAEFIGVSRQMYIKYENGETELSASSIQKLCELYNVSADVILGIRNDEKTKSASFKNSALYLGEIPVPYGTSKHKPLNLYIQQIIPLLENLQIADKITLLGILANQIQDEKVNQKEENSGHPKFGLAKGKFSYPQDIHLYDDEVAKLFGV